MTEVVMEGFNKYKRIEELCDGDTFLLNGCLLVCVFSNPLSHIDCYNFATKYIESFETPSQLQRMVQMVDCKITVTPTRREEKE